jgi:hypothetical protein
MDEQTGRHLELIRATGDVLGAAGIDWWLFGGWAIDFHAGRITRAHSDIEFYVWNHDADAARAALTEAGFLAPPGLHPEEGQPYLKDGQEVGSWFLLHDAEGRIVTPGRWADWPWYPGAFDGPPLTLDGVTAGVVTLEALLDTKANFAKHPHGAPLREKDVADIALLRALLKGRSKES